MYTFKSNINAKEKENIIDALKSNDDYDMWGLVLYGNDYLMVDYNICIDNSTEKPEISGAFYRLSARENGSLSHDNCSVWYPYMIDFTDTRWEEKLKKAAQCAFKKLFDTNLTKKTVYGEQMTDAQFDRYITTECKRQWQENQEEMYGAWNEQPWNVKNEYYMQMYHNLLDK